MSLSVIWLSADPIARGALGVTGRIECARYLLEQGLDVVVICGAEPHHRPVEGVPTVFIPSRYLPLAGWLSLWPGVVRELAARGQGADVVVTDFAMLPPLVHWRSVARRDGRPVPRIVLDVRTPPVEAAPARLALQRARFALTLRAYGRRVEAITAISEGLAGHVAGLARVDPSSITVWRSGSSWAGSDTPPSGAWPPELPAHLQGRFLVVYHGNLSSGRGLPETVEALSLAGCVAPDMTLVLLGDGPALSELKALAARLGVADRIAFVDPVPHHRVPEFLRVAQVGIVPLPPKWEWQVSSPVKLAEYLSAGLPVVLTGITPHRIVGHAPFAFWARSNDPLDLAAALAQAYAERPRLADLGRQAREWAASRLTWSSQAATLEGVLRRVTEPARAKPSKDRALVGGRRPAAAAVRVAVVTNMWPYRDRPAYGTFVEEQVRSLRREGGIEVDAFVMKPQHSRWRYLRAGRVARAIARGRYDVIHCHHPFTLLALAPYRMRLLRRQRVVLTIHGIEGLAGWRRWLTRAALRLADEVVVTNEALRRAHGGRLIPCGVDTSRFHPNGHRATETLRVVTVGEDRPEKQRWLAAGAVSWARRQNPVLPFEHEFVSGLSPESMPRVYQEAHVLLLSSRNEGSPMVVQESLASGVRVVTTDVGDLAVRYGEGDGVYVAGDQSDEALGRKLLQALSAARRRNPVTPSLVRLEDTARELADLYRRVAGRSAR